MKNKTIKRGQSEVISTVLLISITLVLALIIWNFSNAFLTSKTKNKIISDNYDAKVRNFNIYTLGQLSESGLFKENEQTNEEKIVIDVQRLDNEENVTGIRFIFYDDSGSSYSYEINDPPFHEIKQYQISNNSLKLSTVSNIKRVSINLIINGAQSKILDEKEL